MSDWIERLNRFVDALQSDRRPDRLVGATPDELAELRFAARLAGSRTEALAPRPAFLGKLRDELPIREKTARRRIMKRSSFLRVAGLFVAGLIAGFGLDRVTRSGRLAVPATPVTPSDAKVTGGVWFAVGPIDKIANQSAIAFDAGAVPAFVLRDGQSVRALSRVCTHMGCLLHYNAAERELDCPCHGAVFDLQGHVAPEYNTMSLPPLPSIDVRVENGTIYVLGA